MADAVDPRTSLAACAEAVLLARQADQAINRTWALLREGRLNEDATAEAWTAVALLSAGRSSACAALRALLVGLDAIDIQQRTAAMPPALAAVVRQEVQAMRDERRRWKP